MLAHVIATRTHARGDTHGSGLRKLAAAIDKIPNFGGNSYEDNVRRFFHQWVDDTKKMDLAKVKDGRSTQPSVFFLRCLLLLFSFLFRGGGGSNF